jgi:hypothetical protein
MALAGKGTNVHFPLDQLLSAEVQHFPCRQSLTLTRLHLLSTCQVHRCMSTSSPFTRAILLFHYMQTFE